MRFDLKITGRRLLLLPVIGVVGALAVSYSGFVSIAANTGHFAIAEWFLHTTMRNSVRTQSLQYALPEGVELSDPALVARAAGHFASSCAVCHGAPGVEQSPSMRAMMPWPPRLEDRIQRWEDRELFWIVQHGIKYSGMPSWVTQDRPDEAWAMAAFLRALPTMTPEVYRALALDGAGGPPAGLTVAADGPGAVEDAIADCARCHGVDGLGLAAAAAGTAPVPAIAGQSESYLLDALVAYAGGERASGIMETAAGIHSQAVLAGVAAHYASQPAAPEAAVLAEARGITLGDEHSVRAARSSTGLGAPLGEVTTAGGPAAVVDPAASGGRPEGAAGLAALGARIAGEGLRSRSLAACDSCHTPGGADRNEAYPMLAGLPEWYLASQLQLFKDGTRGGGPYAHLMDKVAIHLTQEQIDALALHYSLQAPAR